MEVTLPTPFVTNPEMPDPESTRFLVDMSEALAAHGAPAHRVEEAMTLCASRIGTDAEFFVTPTAVFSSIGSGEESRTRLCRVEPAAPNLDLLVRLDDLLQRVSAGETSTRDGIAQIASIQGNARRYPILLEAASIAVASAGAAVFFSGGWGDIIASGAIGLVLGLVTIAAIRMRDFARLFEFAAGFLTAVGAGLASSCFDSVHMNTVIISSLIVLFPGLTLTIAVTELATRHYVSGTARFIGAATIMATIGFGVATGQAVLVNTGVAPAVIAPSGSLPVLASIVSLIVSPVALSILFNARLADFPAITFTVAAGFLAARYGADATSPELGVCAGAFVVGIISNARAVWRNLPASVTLVPGIILLVPGSIGFRSLSAFMENRSLDGIQTAFLAIIVAVALVIGLLMANVVLPPKRAL